MVSLRNKTELSSYTPTSGQKKIVRSPRDFAKCFFGRNALHYFFQMFRRLARARYENTNLLSSAPRPDSRTHHPGIAKRPEKAL